MKARHLVLPLAALISSGCSSVSDRIIHGLGGPDRGFLTPAVFTDAGGTRDHAITTTGVQAPGICVARGYLRGTDKYNRCVVSVEENLRTRR